MNVTIICRAGFFLMALAWLGCAGKADEEVSDVTSMWPLDSVQSPSDTEPDTTTVFPELGPSGGGDVVSEDTQVEVVEDTTVPSDTNEGDSLVVEADTQDSIEVVDAEITDAEALDTFTEIDTVASTDAIENDVLDVDEPAQPIEGTFLLDTTGVLTSTQSGEPSQGTLVVTHNSVVAIPLFTSPEVKAVTSTGPETLVQVQTLLGCFGNEEMFSVLSDATISGDGMIELGPGNNTLVQPVENEGPYPSAEVLDVGTLIVALAFDVPQNEFSYIPGNYCFGYRTQEGKWFYDFTPRDPFLTEEGGLGTVVMNAEGIDMIAILFDKTTPVTFISYEGSNLNHL